MQLEGDSKVILTLQTFISELSQPIQRSTVKKSERSLDSIKEHTEGRARQVPEYVILYVARNDAAHIVRANLHNGPSLRYGLIRESLLLSVGILSM